MTATHSAASRQRAPLFRVRWKIYLFMWGLALLAYLQKRGLAVASVRIMPELGLSQVALGRCGQSLRGGRRMTLCFAAVEMTEGPFWAAVMEVARADTMAATGVLNTGGNIGGNIVATPIIAYLSAQHYWTAAFLVGSVFGLTGAATWLLVDPTRRMAPAVRALPALA